MNNTYDVAIIGSGVAGAFAALKLAKENKNLKTILFDLGRPPGKRRRQIEGWFGVFPNSDGKLYMHDVQKVGAITGGRKAKAGQSWVLNYFDNHIDYKITDDKKMYVGAEKRMKKHGFEYHYNDYIQLYPREIHTVSKRLADDVENSGKVRFSFDNEVYSIHKQKGMFSIVSSQGEFLAKKILIAVGRSGWRWATKLFHTFGIVESDDTASFGIHAEISSSYMKDFNKSNCTFFNDELEVGPLSWNGTVIPEDHLDLAISAFRSNENRWKSDKVSFRVIGFRKFENAGVEQTNRLGTLAFVLANDRISKERISTLIHKKSKISVIPEYNWLVEACENISNVIPDFISKGYFHIPTILPLPPKIRLGNNFSTEIDNLYVAGESAGIPGLMSAAVSGALAAESILK